jgi:DNA invertase Pin-like site-specific DNA recombinase
MRVGYARVSTHEQNLELQLDALKKAGCERVFEDKASGAKSERPGLAKAREMLRPGDTLVVWRLDRLGRSLKHLIEAVTELDEAGVGFLSLTENIDTTTNGGRLVFHIFGALAEFERGLIRERTLAGLAAARARGRKGGRPKKMDAKKLSQAKALLASRDQSVADVASLLKVGRATLYRALKEADAESEAAKGAE